MGVVGIYVLLAADFVAMVQLLVYVGGILVLTIFAVMLTQGIADVTISNRAVGTIPALIVTVLAGAVMLFATLHTPWHHGAGDRRADHLWNRQRLSRYLRAAVRDRVDGAAGGAGRGDRDLAPVTPVAGIGERAMGRVGHHAEPFPGAEPDRLSRSGCSACSRAATRSAS